MLATCYAGCPKGLPGENNCKYVHLYFVIFKGIPCKRFGANGECEVEEGDIPYCRESEGGPIFLN